MYHPPKRRKELLKRTLVYGLMCLSVALLVVVLLFIVLGYRFNRSDGRIEQGGLLQFDSRPSGADVTIDNAALGPRTASKATVSAGQHYITMNRDGYKQWQKSVTVAPGSVVWLNYARLIPNELKVENVTELSKLTQSLASLDGKWMAVKEDVSTPVITLFDISREAVKHSSIELPAGSYTPPAAGKTQGFTFDTWDPSNRYLLVKHTYNGDGLEWLMVDTENVAQTVNLTKLLNVPMTRVVFSGASSNTLYAQTGSDVRKVDVAAATLSRPLVSNVADFSVFDRTNLVFSTAIAPETRTRSIGFYEDGADKPRILNTYTDDGTVPLKVALGKYFNEPYVAIGYGEAIDIYRGNLPSENATVTTAMTHETSFTQPGGVEYLEIRNNGRFVVVQTAGNFQVYDNELKQTSKTLVKNAISPVSKLAWLDNYYAWSDAGGTLRFYEFDGTNQNDIMAVTPGQSVTLAQDGLYVYGFTASANGTHSLSRVRL